MSFLTALRAGTIVGWTIGGLAFALITGVTVIAKSTTGTHNAVLAHEAADVVRDRATAGRDTTLLVEVRGMRRDNNVNGKAIRCLLAADTRAEKRACEKQSFVEGP